VKLLETSEYVMCCCNSMLCVSTCKLMIQMFEAALDFAVSVESRWHVLGNFSVELEVAAADCNDFIQ